MIRHSIYSGRFLRLAVVLLFFGTTVSAYATVQVRELDVCLPDCPEGLQELRIALISDLHLTINNFTSSVYREMANILNRKAPHLILIAGDFFNYKKTRDPEELSGLLANVFGLITRPELGFYAVLGNHDHAYKDDAEIRDTLKKAGIYLLHEEIIRISFLNDSFFLAGTEQEAGEALSDDLLQKMTSSSPCIFLAHFPEVFDKIPEDQPVLMLAGHTHGGIIRIPGMRDGAFMAIMSPKHQTKYPYGYYTKGRKQLYVTSGIGGEGLSKNRINNPPEVVIIRLHAVRPKEETR